MRIGRATRTCVRWSLPAGAAVPRTAAADPGPVNPEDRRRLHVYPQVEVEPTADVCPSGPTRHGVDQGPDGADHLGWPGPNRRGKAGEKTKLRSGHRNGPPAPPTKGPPANPSSSTLWIVPRVCRSVTRYHPALNVRQSTIEHAQIGGVADGLLPQRRHVRSLDQPVRTDVLRRSRAGFHQHPTHAHHRRPGACSSHQLWRQG